MIDIHSSLRGGGDSGGGGVKCNERGDNVTNIDDRESKQKNN